MKLMFQSTRPRGARPPLIMIQLSSLQFQSTRPRGARLQRYTYFILRGGVSIHAPAWGATAVDNDPTLLTAVSIHAPAWGATSALHLFHTSRGCFNPRARVGRDEFWINDQGSFAWFQSTRPRGARQAQVYEITKGIRGFNPRARVGRDMGMLGMLQQQAPVSIHAPAWGAT